MNNERRMTLDYIGHRISQYRQRGIGQEALQALGTLAGDLRVERHLHPLAGQHRAYRQQDEYYCSRCHKRWPVSEDAPEECG